MISISSTFILCPQHNDHDHWSLVLLYENSCSSSLSSFIMMLPVLLLSSAAPAPQHQYQHPLCPQHLIAYYSLLMLMAPTAAAAAAAAAAVCPAPHPTSIIILLDITAVFDVRILLQHPHVRLVTRTQKTIISISISISMLHQPSTPSISPHLLPHLLMFSLTSPPQHHCPLLLLMPPSSLFLVLLVLIRLLI